MKNALIFGVTGQDGSYLADFLIKKGYNVFGTFRRTSHRCFERVEELGIFENFEKIKADLADQTSINAAIRQAEPDEVYNLAAQSFVGASFQQPILTADVTGIGTLRILDSIRENAPEAKFYQASSSEMFGNEPGVKNEQTYLEKYWDQTLKINLTVAFNCSQTVMKFMLKKKNGSIINITSINAELGFPNNPAYIASKGGLKMLGKSMAKDLGKYGIRVNNLGPGYIKTDMTKKSFSNKKLRKERAQHTMLGRWGEKDDLVGPCIFLSL